MTRFVGNPLRGTNFSAAGDEAVSTKVNGDTIARLRIDAGGRLTWGDGSSSGDTTLYRSSANVLKTDDTFEAASGVITLTTAGTPTATLADGAIAVDTTNNKFFFRSGSTWTEVTSSGTSDHGTLTGLGDDDHTQYLLANGTRTATSLNVTNNITLGGTVDGRDVAADGTKLDGIESGADVTDATNVETAIEAITLTSVTGGTGDEVLIVDATDGGLKAVLWQNLPGGAVDSVNSQTGAVVLDADDISDTLTTNKFTTAAEISKLAGIETGATADQTAADIRGLGFFDTTNDGTGSGLDADLLDGNHATAFATAAQGSTADSALQNVVEDTTPQLGGALDVNGKEITGAIDLHSTGDIITELGDALGVNKLSVRDSAAVEVASIDSDGNFSLSGTVDGRDVAADGTKLDGIAAGAEVNAVDSVNTQTGAVVLDADDISDTSTTNKFTTAADISKLAGIESGATADQTAADIRGLGFFDTTNDGTGSGLDADLLDGNHATAFATAAQGSTADSALQNVVEDTTPQLGGALDVNGKEITGAIDLHSTGDIITELGDALGVNKLSVRDSAAVEVAAFDSDGNLTLSGTVDGRDVAADGTKLDGIAAGAEVNAVDSVNTQTGAVVLDADDISDTSTTNKFTTAANNTKLGHISVTQAVDLDAIETRVNQLDAAVVLQGSWDASAGSFPGSGSAQAGDSYIVSVAGTVNSVAFSVNDRLLAIVDNASTTTYASNWLKLDYTDQVLSVNSQTGSVVLDADDISDASTTNKFTTAADITKLAGIETGATADQTAADIRGLGFFDTSNDGAGSGLDADLLDGNHASAFATAAQGSTADSALQNVVEDTTPQLGGALDVNGKEITGAIDLHSTGDIVNELGDALGVNKLSVRDSAAVEVAAFDSDGNLTLSGTVDGRDVATDGSKLDGIESGATADQTAADIRSLGFFDATNDGTGSGLDADLLDGNHASAFATAAQGSTADSALQNVVEDTTPQLGGSLDVNGQEITGAIDLHSTGDIVNELGDALGVNKLSVRDSAAVEVASIDSDGNFSLSGTVDGRDVAADGTKLDGIAAGAEVNAVDSVNSLTGAVVLDADDISDAATTNKFTTAADITKLAGIETGADVTDAANVETAIEAITLTSVTGANGDEVLVVDATDGGLKAVLWENLPSGGGGSANITVSDTAPSSPSAGELWFDSTSGDILIYYDSFWVDVGGDSVANIAVQSTAPTDPVNGDIWLDSDVDILYIYYDDGVTQEWISAAGIQQVNAGTNLNGGGTTATVTLNLDDDITLTSVTADLNGPVHIPVKNTSGGTLAKGTPVYATGSVGASGAVEVSPSDADVASTMPALGLLNSQLANNAEGDATVLGIVKGINTSSYTVNDELYVSTTAGTLTATRPTGASELVQKIGRVVRVDASTGEILVLGSGRANDVPNGALSNDTTGNAATATALETARTINGVSFDGTANITVAAAAGTLTGTTLASGVTASSLTSVGTLSALSVGGNITVTGTVDGRDVAADGTKLDGIETGATADQTAADIRGLGFFDTTNDGTGSGLDADLLDGNHATAFATAAQGSTADSALQNVVEDTTPQLGGALDVNGQEITGAIDLHSTGDVIVELGDALGTNKVSVRDSAAAEVASIDSDGVINAQEVVIAGNLTVSGTTTTSNSTTVTVDDPIFTLGGDTAPTSDDNKDRGIEFRWHNGTTAKTGFFGFDDSSGYFTFIPDGTNTAEVFSGTKGDLDINNLIVAGTVDGRDIAADGSKLDGIAAGAEVNTVDSVNSLTGAVVLDPDDLSDAATTNKFTTAADISKLAGIETGADVTDAANVETAIEAITLTSVTGATGDEMLIVDATDGGLKAVLWQDIPFGMNNVVEDTTPQLGGALDVNGQEITGAIDLHSTGDVIIELGDAAGVNKVSVRDSGAVEQFLIDSDGNVGVGKTPNSGSRLDVNGRIEAYQNTLQTNNDDYAFITSGNFGGGYGFYEGTNRAVIVAPGGNQMEFFVGGSPTSWGTMAIDIDSSGNVTIPVTLNGVDPDNFADMTGSSNAGRKITVTSTQPSSPTTGDVWIDIS